MPSYAEYSTDLTGVPSTPGVQTPNVLAGREANYKPGFWEVQQAYLTSAYKGEGTAYFNLSELSNRVIPDASPVLTEPEWKESELYRPGLQYYDGMTQNEAKNRADIHDDIRQREFIIEKATGAQKAAGFLTALIGGAAEPQNVASGIAVSAAFSPTGPLAAIAGPASTFAKALPRAYGMTLGPLFKAKRTVRQAVAYGVVTGAVGDALIEPLNYAAAKSFGEPYDSADVLMNLAQSALFGGLFEGGAQYLKNRRSIREDKTTQTPPIESKVSTRVDTINEFDSVITQLSNDEVPDPSGQRRFSMVNKYYKEYGPELNQEFDTLRFIMFDNMDKGVFFEGREDSPGFFDFLPERVIHWAIDSEEYHTKFNGDVYDQSNLRYLDDKLDISWSDEEVTSISRRDLIDRLSLRPEEREPNPDIDDLLRVIFEDDKFIMDAGDTVHTGVMSPEVARFISWVYREPTFEGAVPSIDSVRSERNAHTPIEELGYVPKNDDPQDTLTSVSEHGIDEDLYPMGGETKEPVDISVPDEEPGAAELMKVQTELDNLIQESEGAVSEDLLDLAEDLRDRGEMIDDMMNTVVVCALRTADEVVDEVTG